MTFGSRSGEHDEEDSDLAQTDSGDGGPVWRDEWGSNANYFENQLHNELVQSLIELAREVREAHDTVRPPPIAEDYVEPQRVSAARSWVEGFSAKGIDDLHGQYLKGTHNYHHSTEHAICRETQKLADWIEEYDKAVDKGTTNMDFETEQFLQQRVEELVKQLVQAVVWLEFRLMEEDADEALLREGRLSGDAHVMRQIQRTIAEQKGRTTVEGAGIGMSPGDIGDAADQAGHVLEDSQADDDGEMRQRIAQKIRSMPRWMALEIIQHAVDDGIISEETARYLIREYVRAR